MLLVGEPFFPDTERAEFFAPAGQVSLFVEVLNEIYDEGQEGIVRELQHEYRAIVRALHDMKVDFRLVCRDIDTLDRQFITDLCCEVGCKLASFAGFRSAVTLYPRDFCAIFPSTKTLLVNPRGIRLVSSFKEDWRVYESIFGEGGRILHTGCTALIGDRVILDDNHSRRTIDADLKVFQGSGIKVGKVPLFVSTSFGCDGRIGELSFNDHLDRIGCLITDRENSLHLILDPTIHSVEWLGDGRWRPREFEETLDLYRSVCGPLGIEVHRPKDIQVPYSLNLLQTEDRRILMTSGDPSVLGLVEDIMGRNYVFVTETAICSYPLFRHAGIRCLVNEMPEAIMKRV